MPLAAIDRLVKHAVILNMNVERYRRREDVNRKRQRGPPATPSTVKNTENLVPDRRPVSIKLLPILPNPVNYPTARSFSLIRIATAVSPRLSRHSLQSASEKAAIYRALTKARHQYELLADRLYFSSLSLDHHVGTTTNCLW